MVSVSVSIAVSPMTGAASFSLTRSISDTSLPILPMASFSAERIPWIFERVPFVPVVFTEALDRKRTCLSCP